MHLHPEWKHILRFSWSVRLLVVAGVLSGAEAALPFWQGFLPVSPQVFGGLTFIVVAAAFAARLVAQKELSK